MVHNMLFYQVSTKSKLILQKKQLCAQHAFCLKLYLEIAKNQRIAKKGQKQREAFLRSHAKPFICDIP